MSPVHLSDDSHRPGDVEIIHPPFGSRGSLGSQWYEFLFPYFPIISYAKVDFDDRSRARFIALLHDIECDHVDNISSGAIIHIPDSIQARTMWTLSWKRVACLVIPSPWLFGMKVLQL